MTYQELTIIYKGFRISQRYSDGYPDSWCGESDDMDRITFADSYQSLIEWIDFLFDGREPLGYFNRY